MLIVLLRDEEESNTSPYRLAAKTASGLCHQVGLRNHQANSVINNNARLCGRCFIPLLRSKRYRFHITPNILVIHYHFAVSFV